MTTPRNRRRLLPCMWPAVLETAEAHFPAGNPFGVLGFGIEQPQRQGRRAPYVSLVVYVERKLQAPETPIPDVPFEHGGLRWTVRPDVQAFGGPLTTGAAAFSANVHFSGLHPGAAIAIGDEARWVAIGAVSCLVGGPAGPTHLLTAGHVFPPGGGPWFVYAAPGGTQPTTRVGQLAGSLLATPTPNGPMDSAVVRLLPGAAGLIAQRTPHLVASLRDAVQAEVVQPFRPTAGTWGARARVSVRPHTFYVSDPLWGLITVSDVAFTAPTTALGDSGTVLCSSGAPREALGSTVGVSAGCSLFEPILRSLAHHAARLGIPLDLWRQ